MKFRNKTEDTRYGTGLGYVEPGATVEVDGETAAGLVLQCGADGAWEPADDEAKQAVNKATGTKTPPRKTAGKKPARKATEADQPEPDSETTAAGDGNDETLEGDK